MPKFADDYIEVKDRIVEFRDRFPDGALQAEVVRWPTEDFPFIVVRAYAFRGQEDGHPGIGHAQERVPGLTPFTKDSELQNAETSAWGRAIVAALSSDTKRGVASADEVRSRTIESPQAGAEKARPPSTNPPVESSAPATTSWAHQEGDGHEHEWSGKAKPGWRSCSLCGKAEKGANPWQKEKESA